MNSQSHSLCCYLLKSKILCQYLVPQCLFCLSALGINSNIGVFQEYYSKLVDCLPVKTLSHYFVSQGVVTLLENEDITSPTTSPRRAAELLFSRVSLALQEGNVVPLKKVLNVMQTHGNDAIVSLSREIQQKLQLDKGIFSTNLCFHLHSTISV